MGKHLFIIRDEYCANVMPWKGEPAGIYWVKYWSIRTPFKVFRDAVGYVVEQRGAPISLPRRNYNMERDASELVDDLWERLSHEN